MSYEVKGTVKSVGAVESFGSNGFTKRELTIETEGQYPQPVVFEFVKDKCSLLDSAQAGDVVTVGFNLRGREWTNPKGEVKTFNSLQGWKFTNEGQEGGDKPPF